MDEDKVTPAELASQDWQQTELADLRLLRECGLPVARLVVVPPGSEEQFYLLNNLSTHLESLFAAINMGFPDDEDVEDLVPAARELLFSHFLLDEFVDSFYESIADLPARLTVRRPGAQGMNASRGRPSLLALKRVWQDEWTFEPLWERVEQGVLLPESRPVLIHDAATEGLPHGLELDAEAIMGERVELWGNSDSGITGVRRLQAR